MDNAGYSDVNLSDSYGTQEVVSMPLIEIICIGQRTPDVFDEFPFAVQSGRELVSHRSPNPLFRTAVSAMATKES